MKPVPLYLFVLVAVSFLFAGPASAQKIRIKLDAFLDLPSAWEMTPEELEKAFDIKKGKRNVFFKWLTKDKSRAHFQRRPYSNLELNLTIFEGEKMIPLEEAIIDFKDGKFLGMTLSLMNRGDSGGLEDLPAEEFNRRFKTCGKEIGARLETRPFRREARPKQGMLTEGWIWISQAGMAVLEHNPEAPETIEYLRLRFARRDAKGAYAAAMQTRPEAAVKLSDLPENVTEDEEGNVFIENIPMVDQGRKGYCVVASAQRLFEYYGIPCDQHQLAQIAEADPNRGTSTVTITNELGKIDHLFKIRFEALVMGQMGRLFEVENNKFLSEQIDDEEFHKIIRKYVDEGIPLLWALQLGFFPEEPAISQQAVGGHMRMIIGYNKKTNRVIFSDSWGAGHEFKTMNPDHAFKASSGLFLLKPITR
ncbi:MAG: hypothetical protein HKN23_14930 [Verrucomicrobiales bacterium]|nr:hypothetical protein [Verrucomicrobiales bacterium]